MIRTLIVDDEYLVRKGMMLTIPWEKYDIEIIGEADSGQDAIEFLAKHPVDLLLTDIMMPNLSGFELIDYVVRQYPNIFVVVITCHQDFDYVQKALRMGAIDYIVKTELEKKELDNNISRIALLIQTKIQSIPNLQSSDAPDRQNSDYGILLLPAINGILNDKDTTLLKDTIKFEIGQGKMLYLTNVQRAPKLITAILCRGNLIAIGVKNADKVTREKLAELLLEYTNHILPYKYSESIFSYELDAAVWIKPVCLQKDRINQINEDLKNINWIFNDTEYERLKAGLLNMRLDMIMLKNIFYKTICELERYLVLTIPEEYFKKLEQARFWVHYESMMQELRAYLASKINCLPYPDETVKAVLNALEYIKANFTEDLKQDSVSKMFNLSRSYFSKVFKEIVGISFTGYIQNLRMEKAKTLLFKTSMPVFRITREIGFLDEKYFGKFFKRYTGYTPTEYRNQKKKA